MTKIMAVLLSILAALVIFLPFGNPVSEFLVTKNSELYLEENFSGTGYYVDDVVYNFKTGNYYVDIRLSGSPDSSFTLYSDMKGKIGYDTYEDAVVHRWNTAGRIDDAYRKAVDALIEGGSIPYDINIGFGEIIYRESGVPVGDVVPEYAISTESLILDKEYDIAEMGKKAGKLTIYVCGDTVTAEKLAEILLAVKKAADEGGVCFKAIDCVLEYPMPDEGERKEEAVRVENFMYEDIYEEGLVDRVKEAAA